MFPAISPELSELVHWSAAPDFVTLGLFHNLANKSQARVCSRPLVAGVVPVAACLNQVEQNVGQGHQLLLTDFAQAAACFLGKQLLRAHFSVSGDDWVEHVPHDARHQRFAAGHELFRGQGPRGVGPGTTDCPVRKQGEKPGRGHAKVKAVHRHRRVRRSVAPLETGPAAAEQVRRGLLLVVSALEHI